MIRCHTTALRNLFAFLLLTWPHFCHAMPVIADLHTDKARYAPRMPVIVSVTLTNGAGQPVARGTVGLTCRHLDTPVPGPAAQAFRLAAGGSMTLRFTWHPPRTDYQGYLVLASVRDSAGRPLALQTTAVDVSSQWAKFLRYGYISECPPQTSSLSRQRVRQLADYHLDALQFYDWQYKHQTPLAGTVTHPAATWRNISNIVTSRQTVLDMIAAAHGLGMAAMNYNLLYGAWSGYGDDGVDYRWGLWKKPDGTDQDRLPMPSGWAVPAIYLFNPGDPGWQRYLTGQEAKVFDAYPFDGWHVDQVGPPAGTDYDVHGKPVDVWPTFKPFLSAAQTALHKPLIFNNVGGYGLFDIAAHTDDVAVYVECWPFMGQTTYKDLKTIIDQGTDWSGGKAVTLAAYMDLNYGNTFSGRASGAFNPPGVLLTDATIFASGGNHIELGDGSAMLSNEYFPNHNLAPSPGLRESLRHYYDFLVAYENLLRDGLRPSADTIGLSVPSSLNAAPNTVWTFAKSGGDTRVLHLINLTGEKDNAWRDDKGDYPVPTPQRSIEVTWHGGPAAVSKVSWASPDGLDITLHLLPLTIGRDAGGAYVRFTVPRLAYWDMICLTTVHPSSPRVKKP